MKPTETGELIAPHIGDIFEHIPIGALTVSETGKILHFNKNFMHLIDVKLNEADIGKSYKRILPKDMYLFIEEYLKSLNSKKQKTATVTTLSFQQKSKHPKHLRLQLSYIVHRKQKDANYILCSLQDISSEYKELLALKQGQHEAQKESSTIANYLNRVIASMPCNVWWTDENSRFIGCNENTYRTAGFKSREDFIGKNPFVLGKKLGWNQGQAEKFREDDLTVMLTGEPIMNALEPPIKMADGRTTYYITTRVPLRDEHNKIIGIIGISTDVTERIEMENELRKANERAEIATKAKLDFLANFSHELRTPLNGILGITNILSQQSLKDDQKYLVEDIAHSGQMLLALVNDILDISKIESNKLVFNETNFQLANSIEEVTNELRHQAQNKGIKLLSIIDPELKTSINTDEQRFKQILINLISNAIKFTEVGYVQVTAEKIRSTNKHIWYQISVEDTGIGISAENAEKIFDRYAQVSSAYTKSHSGTGLGLNIVESLVNMMGGEISVQSQLGVGTTFTLNLKSRMSTNGIIHNNLSSIAKHLSLFIIDDNLESGEKLLSYFHEFDTQLATSNRALDILKENAKRLKFSNIIIINDDIKKQNLPKLIHSILDDHTLRLPILLLHTQNPKTIKKKPSGIFKVISTQLNPKNLSDIIQKAYNSYINQQEKMADEIRKHTYKILLVEDNNINQKIVTIMLNNLNCKVTVAGDYDSAIAKHLESDFDLIFMDIGLPGKDGFELTHHIRQLPQKPVTCPIVAMTAYASEEDKNKCLSVGMDDFVSKPLDQPMLIFVLTRWLKKSTVKNRLKSDLA